jgi:hypothetical protein
MKPFLFCGQILASQQVPPLFNEAYTSYMWASADAHKIITNKIITMYKHLTDDLQH